MFYHCDTKRSTSGQLAAVIISLGTSCSVTDMVQSVYFDALVPRLSITGVITGERLRRKSMDSHTRLCRKTGDEKLSLGFPLFKLINRLPAPRLLLKPSSREVR